VPPSGNKKAATSISGLTAIHGAHKMSEPRRAVVQGCAVANMTCAAKSTTRPTQNTAYPAMITTTSGTRFLVTGMTQDYASAVTFEAKNNTGP